jgi:FKBP-type peptidyl-prolyl cis-trans isomerase SlyD
MPFRPNQVVIIHYTLKDDLGNLVDSTNAEEPFAFLSGQEEILPKLEEQLSMMQVSSRKTVVLKPEEAYGIYEKDDIEIVKRSDFPHDTELEVGMDYVAETEEGETPFTITRIDGDDVTIDFNHPLAGRTLTFDVQLVNVRDASAEELNHGHAHGDGGIKHQD